MQSPSTTFKASKIPCTDNYRDDLMKHIYKCKKCGKYVEVPVHCSEEAELLLDKTRRLLLSKLLSGLLRHYPWEAGLRINSEGWVNIDELIRGIKTRWRNRELYRWVTKEHIIAIAELDPKGRFEIRDNMIRARYGHSIDVRIRYPLEYPSIQLYHGTSTDKLAKILIEGLKPMRRKYVHLTTSIENAVETGKRHGKPVVLIIDIECLKEQKIPVYRAAKIIYLAPRIPPQCIKQTIKPPSNKQ